MENNEIKLLEFPHCVRERSGMYIGGVEDASVLFREICDNATDESYAYKGCDKIIIDQDWNGYHLVADNGRGLPISMSADKPEQTQADISLSMLHSGSKFGTTEVSRSGLNGVGSSVSNALSESYILMSKITEQNYNKSLPVVEQLWNSVGPRSKKDLFYIIAFERGIKVYEGAHKIAEIERLLWEKYGQPYKELPKGFSTIVMFKPDPTIFDKVTSKIPEKNIQYFLLIQEKFYRRKVGVMINGVMAHETFQPYQFEMLKTIIPKDNSKNKDITAYITFDVDPELGKPQEEGSVNGLVTESGVHINYIETCFEAALKSEFKITHKYLQNGLKICVIMLMSNAIFDSQTKARLKSIAKVKQADFGDITKEFVKMFRANRDYWEEHVAKLNLYAESMKSFSAEDKIKKMIESGSGNNRYRSKAGLIEGFAEATSPNRMECELMITEGLSAASPLRNGRVDNKRAILPLRGKPMNVFDKTTEEVLANKELNTIFTTISLGMDVYNVTTGAQTPEEAWERICKNSRYGKVILIMDEDSDGKIIETSLLYAFSRFGKFLINWGMVYLMETPFFMQDSKYFYSSDPLQTGSLFPVGLNPNKPFTRFKGIGSLSKNDIYDIFYNPDTRRLIQVTPENIEYSMSLVEDINQRKKLLYDAGILSNPFNFTDL